jgi:hypothetical protein
MIPVEQVGAHLAIKTRKIVGGHFRDLYPRGLLENDFSPPSESVASKRGPLTKTFTMAVSATSSSAKSNSNNNNKTKRGSSPKAKEALTSCHKKKNGNATATTSSSNNNKDRYPIYRDFGRVPFDCGHKFYSSTSLDIYDPEDSSVCGRGGSPAPGHGGGRGGKKSTFPKMLYEMVDDADGVENDYTDVIAWMPHGRSFVIKDKHRFTDEILPRHFGSQNSFASFQRQLNVYGFLRMTKDGPDRKSYYHERFLRGRPDLIAYIPRKRKTTARVRRSLDPSTEPNLYLFPPCLARKSGVDGRFRYNGGGRLGRTARCVRRP